MPKTEKIEDNDLLETYLSAMEMLNEALSDKGATRKGAEKGAEMLLCYEHKIKSFVAHSYPPISGVAIQLAFAITKPVLHGLFLNKKNCQELAKCITKTLVLLLTYAKHLKKSKELRVIEKELEDCLQEGLEYVKKFVDSSNMGKIWNANDDKAAFERITKKINEIVDKLKHHMQFKDHSILQELKEIQYEHDKKDQRIRQYVQRGVEKLDNASRRDLLELCSGEIQLLAYLFLQWNKRGPSAHLKNPFMQYFWQKHAKDEEKITWDKFWSSLVLDESMPGLPDKKQKLKSFVAEHYGKASKYRRLVEKCTAREEVDVYVLNFLFRENADVLEVLREYKDIIDKIQLKSSNNASKTAPHVSLPPCRLPAVNLIGRQAIVDEVCNSAKKHRLVMLNGTPGSGKAAVACAAGRKLYEEGTFPGGAFRVDLAGVETDHRILESILDGLQGQDANPEERQATLRAHLKLLAKTEQPFLLLLMHVDINAETLGGCADAFHKLVKNMLDWAPSMKVILSSRQELSILGSGPEARAFKIQGLSPTNGKLLLKRHAPDVGDEDADAIAKRLNFTPLLLILFGNALRQGSMTVLEATSREEIDHRSVLTALSSFYERTINMMDEDTRLAALLLTLLPRKFQKTSAARVLGMDDINGKLKFLVFFQWLELKGDRSYEMPLGSWNAGRELLKKMQEEGVRQGRLRLVELAVGRLRENMDYYADWPSGGFQDIKDDQLLVQEALSTLTKDASLLHSEVMDGFLPMLYVDVYDAPTLSSLFEDLEKMLTKEHHALAICGLLHAFFMPHAQKTEKQRCLRKVNEALTQLGSCGHSVEAVTWRKKGVLTRGIRNYAESCQYLRKARSIITTVLRRAGEHAESTWEMEYILINAELAGALDYYYSDCKSETVFAEGSEVAQESVRAATRFLGKDHPLRAFCLIKLGYFFNASKNFQKAIELYKDSLEIQLRVLGTSHEEVAQSYNQLALSQKELGYFAEAAENCEKGLDIRRRLGKIDMIRNSLVTKGQVYFEWMNRERNVGYYIISEQAFDKALEYQLELDSSKLSNISAHMLHLYETAEELALDDPQKISSKLMKLKIESKV